MTYNEFLEELLDKLDEKVSSSASSIGRYRLYEDGEIGDNAQDKQFIIETNIKYNKSESEVLKGDFLSVLHTDKTSLARFSVQYLYDSYQRDGWEFVGKIIDDNLSYASSTGDMQEILNSLNNYEAVKDRIIVRPLNYTDNKLNLRDSVYRQVGDMALVLYLFISDTPKYGLLTTKIPQIVVDNWGKDIDEVMETALVNANIKSVPRMYNNPMKTANPTYSEGAYMALGSNYKLTRISTFTTYPNMNGAISFFYPGVKEKIAEMAGGDYYVVFTGICEFHVHPVNEANPRQLLSSLKYMNKSMNKPGETLTRKIYRYNVETKELVMMQL
jgi:hypothetical protein